MVTVYLSRKNYDAVIGAILTLPASILQDLQCGVAVADDMKLAIGEHGDVWPASILADFGAPSE